MLVPVLLLLVLAGLARRSWRYERVRPPFKGGKEPPRRTISAAALDRGLADDEFWDGENSVRLLTELHLATAAGFLAIVLAVTAKLLTASGSAHATALGWIALAAGGATMACAVAYLALDSRNALGDALRGTRRSSCSWASPPWSAQVCSPGSSPGARLGRRRNYPG